MPDSPSPSPLGRTPSGAERSVPQGGHAGADAVVAPLAIALLSGGLDSATAAALALESGHRVIGLSFDYGQRHRRELQAAAAVARRLGLQEHRVLRVDLAAWGGSSLTDPAQELPHDGVQPDVIPSTYVPGRNTVFIALGLSLAEAVGASRLVLGVNAVDYSGYPDCRPDYLEAFQALADLASRAGREGRGVQLWSPLVSWDKPRILREALRLGVPLAATWSCYAGGDQPCGVCDSCRIRDEALIAVGRADLAGVHRDGVEPPLAGERGEAPAGQLAHPGPREPGARPPGEGRATELQTEASSAGAPSGSRPQAMAAGDPAVAGLGLAAPRTAARDGAAGVDRQCPQPLAAPVRADALSGARQSLQPAADSHGFRPGAQGAADLPEASGNQGPAEAGSTL